MPLDPECEALLAPLRAAPSLPPLDQVPPAVMRQMFKQMPGARAAGDAAASGSLASVENRRIPGPAGEIPIRVYKPTHTPGLPVLVYFHGGGFVICDLDTHDATCRDLAQQAGCAVVSVDYRLAPESKFPAAPEDCYAATQWVAKSASAHGMDPARIAIGGDSAGGNLTAVVALMARERGGPALVHQLLVYPVTDCAFETRSYVENADGYLLSRDMMKWFWGHYLADPADAANPLASPLRAANLRGLPPATLITAEFDPLRDEGEAYGAKLRAAGVPVNAVRYDGVIHGFFAMTELMPKARDAVALAARDLSAAFAR